jgi:hypothetical protein
MITQDDLKSLFSYSDGHLFWKISSGRIRAGAKAGCVRGNRGYESIGVDKKRYGTHQLVWILFNGAYDSSLQIDHINRIKTDNRIENLRLATQAENTYNKIKRVGTSSVFKGVSWSKQQNKWVAAIWKNKIKIFLGLFEIEEDAAKAYEIAAVEIQNKFKVIIQ